MQIALDNPSACLAKESPREYTQQLMAGALALQKMRQGKGVGKEKDALSEELEQLRGLMEPHTTGFPDVGSPQEVS